MERSGQKTMVIILLVIVNLVGAAVLGVRTLDRVRTAEALRREAERYVASCGVAVSAEVLSGESKSYEIIQLARDIAAENELAEAWLGQARRQDIGRGVTEFVGESGSLTLRTDGSLSLTATRPDMRPETVAQAKRLAERFVGAALDLSGATVTAERWENGFRVRFHDHLSDAALHNGRLTLILTNEGELTLSGTWRRGDVLRKLSLSQVVPAAVVAEFAGKHAQRLGITEITALQEVYWIYPEQTGEITLLPALRLETDQGELVLDVTNAELLEQ